MKKITLVLSLIVCFSTTLFSQNKSGDRTVFGRKINPENIAPSGHVRCVTNEYEEYLRSQNPKTETQEQFENWMAQKIKEQKDSNEIFSQSGGIIYIPVVVHVIHNGDAYGTNENITDEQVQSQITVMTQDFRKMVGTPGYNTNAVGADTQIEFVLAKVDPNGNPTNGINRINLCQASWSTDAINATVKPSTIWDPTQYMNMWSVNFSDSSLLGYAQFPESSLAGMDPAAQNPNTDGVVAGYKYFGSSSLATGPFQAPFDKGRTMTHEVGHFLGLRHIWGDTNTCPATNTANDKDFVADTPAASGPNYGCTAGTNSCPSNPGNDMIQNYMDYTNDTCMNLFTVGQSTRITTVMNNSPRRSSLKTSTKDVAIALFANDAEVKIENACGVTAATCATPNPSSPLKSVMLYNRGTSNLTSATLSYNINGGTTYTYNWTGNLATNKYAMISLANTNANGLLTVTVTAANGTDQRASNNVATKSFGTPLAYANATSFTFNLVTDQYASEISWTLKNAAGTTLYSGGPYADGATNTLQNVVTNQSWTLPANGCYYLTVTDSYGDGLYDGVNQGYYTVTAGATTVVNVPDFVVAGNPANTVVTKVSYFTNNVSLDNESFSLIEDVTLYPNPSKDNFTIDVPQGIERKGKMEIYNSIGQIVTTRTISSDTDLSVNVSNFSNGVYFLNLNLDGASKTLKFIKE